MNHRRPFARAFGIALFLLLGCDDGGGRAAGDDARGEWTPGGKGDDLASCYGYCGGMAADGCWCDAECSSYGDCCPDLASACYGEEPNESYGESWGESSDGGEVGGESIDCSLPTDSAWSCGALTGTTTNPDRVYFTTSFGCWVDANGKPHSDGDDNCIPACSLASIGCNGMTGPECEREINWYAADSDRFGCGTKLLVTNPDNGKSAVLMAIDRGPNCKIENKVDHWVLDMSYRASIHLFGESTSAEERADVLVEVVDPSTPVGATTMAPSCG